MNFLPQSFTQLLVSEFLFDLECLTKLNLTDLHFFIPVLSISLLGKTCTINYYIKICGVENGIVIYVQSHYEITGEIFDKWENRSFL
jgi:hypothetical protein